MHDDLIYIWTAILLPLVPSVVIYRLLNRYAPTTARVRGTPGLFGFLKGLKVDLQGAGASYFVLVLVIFGYVATRPPRDTPPFSIEGRLALQPPATINPDAVRIAVLPPQVTVMPGGLFRVQLAVSDPRAPLPALVVSYPGHDRVTIELDAQSHYRTPNLTVSGSRISLGDPVTLTRLDEEAPPYAPSPSPPPE